MKLIDLTGRRFGRLTVVARAENDGRKVRWLCDCECGNSHVALTMLLTRGRVISCGCYRDELRIRHGRARTKVYRAWAAMIQRCHNTRCVAYRHYGGRGITVCDRWRADFLDFFMDVGEAPTPKHTLERIKNDLGYMPGNVRWATRAEQSRNHRNSVLITIGGETRCAKDWERTLGVWRPVWRAWEYAAGLAPDDAILAAFQHHAESLDL